MSLFQLAQVTETILALDRTAMDATQKRLDSLTKPRGSLGRLEQLAVRLAGIQANPFPAVFPAAVAVMAADHGVTAEGVSAYPSEVTAQMVYNFMEGGAAINVFSRQAGARVYVIDVGIKGVLSKDISHPDLLERKVRPGTDNMAVGPAMSREDAEAAIAVGAEVADIVAANGAVVLATGEMGIGNTTAATALLCALRGAAPEDVTGNGTGIDFTGRQRKVAAIKRALTVNASELDDPLGVLAAVGGLEIAAMAGYILRAAELRRAVVLDGLISTSAALVACDLCPPVHDYLIASHLSQEPGHQLMLHHLGLAPLLHLDMRVGEGTGAILALPLLEAAVRVLSEMTTFTEAGVSDRDG